jgi:WhiB family redox-sensing transcriptional regulator
MNAIDPADDDSGMYTAPADIYDLPTFAGIDGTWRANAACRGMDTDEFFPGRGASVAPAMAVCAGCPVATECHNEAMTDPTISGIWGATSHRQRRAARSANNPVESLRHRKPIVHGTNRGYQAHQRRLDDPGPCDACIKAHTEDRRRTRTTPRRRPKAPRTITATHTDKAAA